MVLAHNILAMNAQRQFNITSTSKRKSTEKLSSGYRINRAADDAAGLTISEKMRSQIRGLSQGVNNCQDGVSLCQIADGALAEVNDMLHRLTELSVKSANGTNTDSDREAIQKEVSQIISEIDRISSSAEFNTMPIFDGSMANSNTIMTAEELLGPIKPVPIAEPESITYSDALEQLRNQTYILANSSFTNPAGSTYPSYMNDKYLNLYISDLSTSVILDDFDKEHVNVYLDQSKAYDLLEKVAKNEYIGTQAFIQEDGYDPTSYSLTNSPSKYVVNHMSTFRLQDIHTVSTGVIARLRSDGIPRFGSTVTSLLQDFDYECQTYKQTGSPAYSVKAYRTSFINGTPGGYIASYSGGRYSGLSAAIGNSGYTIAQAVNDYQVAYSEIMKQKNAKAVDDYDEYLKNYDKTYEDYKNRVENASGVWIQAGASAGNGFEIYFDEMNSSVLGLKDIDISTEAGAKGSIDIINRASDRISSMRSDIGAQQNRLEHTIKNENNIVDNTQAAESRIRDTDMATEMVNNTKLNILEQAVTSMMAQANQSTQGILSLLQ